MIIKCNHSELIVTRSYVRSAQMTAFIIPSGAKKFGNMFFYQFFLTELKQNVADYFDMRFADDICKITTIVVFTDKYYDVYIHAYITLFLQ